jgi:hypothetical protein
MNLEIFDEDVVFKSDCYSTNILITNFEVKEYCNWCSKKFNFGELRGVFFFQDYGELKAETVVLCKECVGPITEEDLLNEN